MFLAENRLQNRIGRKAHDAGKIPKSLPKYLTAIYNPEVRKKRRSAERRRKK